MTTLGIIGAGRIGSNVARAVIAHGYDVVIANSRAPETLTELVAELGPHARAATAEQAATEGDLVLVAIPFHAYESVPVEPLDDKVVLDANNYYYERDGHVPSLDAGETTTSGLLQAHLPQAKVVKVFNGIDARDIPVDGTSAGTEDRRALPLSSDHPDALQVVAALLDELGFDSVPVVPLAESWRFERDRPAYGIRQTRAELVANLAKATRTI
jgi:8-hydroxy-5-deazaflavin:NADPH oxidoreductase